MGIRFPQSATSLGSVRAALRSRRAFSMFPDGWAGLGLLLLRVAAGSGLLLYGGVQLLQHDLPFVMVLSATIVVGCGFALLLGYFTQIAAVLGALTSLSLVFERSHLAKPHIPDAQLSSAFLLVIAIALVCLGPGAFSLDAVRHGRREIIIPQKTERSLDE
jgi:uncharacterized membrane protein YphA (DoxX/SURF4 family)